MNESFGPIFNREFTHQGFNFKHLLKFAKVRQNLANLEFQLDEIRQSWEDLPKFVGLIDFWQIWPRLTLSIYWTKFHEITQFQSTEIL